MGVSRVINRRTAVLGLLLVILATAGFGFAATNTVDESSAGDGAAEISGYDITDIDYTLVNTAPDTIESVSFELNGDFAPDDVRVQLDGTAWFPCTGAGLGSTYTCSVAGAVTVEDATSFRVVAAQ